MGEAPDPLRRSNGFGRYNVTDANQIFLIVAAFFLLFIVLLTSFYAIRRLRLRRTKLSLELAGAPGVVDDRAFNAIRLARSEADVLEHSGSEVGKARDLLLQAQKRYDLRDFSEALSLAKSAHESLVALRRHGPTRVPSTRDPSVHAPAWTPRTSVGPGTVDSMDPAERTDARDGTAPSPPPVQRMAKNRAESHFQMTLLAEELEGSQGETSGGTAMPSTLDLQRQAQDAYAGGNYTDALRIALKARRALGVRLETLPPPRTAAGPAPATPPRPGEGGEESPLGETPCPQCGRPTRASDRFCRGCGAPRAAGRCPRCGLELAAGDTYCGSCGSPVT